MTNAQTKYQGLSDEYFAQDTNQKTILNLINFMGSAKEIVELNKDDLELFEDVNLEIQQAVAVFEQRTGNIYFEEIRETLLGYEDLESVLGEKGKILDAIQNWCDYIDTVVNNLTELHTNT